MVAQRDSRDRRRGEHERHEAFGEHTDSERRVHPHEPARTVRPAALRRLPAPERAHHRRGEDHVGPQRACLEDESERRREGDAGRETGALAVEQSAEAARREQRDGGGRDRYEPRPFRRAGDAEDERREPESQRGLVEEEPEIEVGRDPVAAEDHLARDLRVPSLVVEEAGEIETDREQRGRAEGERDRSPRR